MANNYLSIAIQADALRRYPTGQIAYRKGNLLVWRWEVQPSSLSTKYTIKLVYRYGVTPKVWVVSPKPLALAEGETSLPHVYSTQEQQICLFYNVEEEDKEWRQDMILANTVVPWISEWLYFYELWLITGTWLGGGVHNGKVET